MTLQIEDALSQFFQTADGSPKQTARELIVIELYRQRRISGGKAAELLGVPRMQFLNRASELGISCIDMDEEEFQQEMESAGKLTSERRF